MSKAVYFSSMLIVLCLGMVFFGCARTAKVNELELDIQQALEIAEEALRRSKSAETIIEEAYEYKIDAEQSALRAEKAAQDAANAADRAEECSKRCEGAFERIMSK